MNNTAVLLILFALFFTYTNSALVFAQNQPLSSQLPPTPPPKVDTDTRDSQNQSGQLQIPTEPPQGDATPLGGLGQQQPSPQQSQNQTKGPLEQLGESVGKMMAS